MVNFLMMKKALRARIKRISRIYFKFDNFVLYITNINNICIINKIEDRGPIFYSQIRNGFEGNQFKIIKLRTMIINAEKDGEQWAK